MSVASKNKELFNEIKSNEAKKKEDFGEKKVLEDPLLKDFNEDAGVINELNETCNKFKEIEQLCKTTSKKIIEENKIESSTNTIDQNDNTEDYEDEVKPYKNVEIEEVVDPIFDPNNSDAEYNSADEEDEEEEEVEEEEEEEEEDEIFEDATYEKKWEEHKNNKLEDKNKYSEELKQGKRKIAKLVMDKIQEENGRKFKKLTDQQDLKEAIKVQNAKPKKQEKQKENKLTFMLFRVFCSIVYIDYQMKGEYTINKIPSKSDEEKKKYKSAVNPVYKILNLFKTRIYRSMDKIQNQFFKYLYTSCVSIKIENGVGKKKLKNSQRCAISGSKLVDKKYVSFINNGKPGLIFAINADQIEKVCCIYEFYHIGERLHNQFKTYYDQDQCEWSEFVDKHQTLISEEYERFNVIKKKLAEMYNIQ